VSDFSALGEPHDFDVQLRGQPVAHVRWSLGGVHNQLNALAAIAAAEHVGVSPEQAAAALGQFENVKRRMEVRGQVALQVPLARRSPFMTILPTTPPPFVPPSTACAARSEVRASWRCLSRAVTP
jgi:hypothetical protein